MDYQHLKNQANTRVTLDAIGSWPATQHYWEEEALYAIIAALASKRPLLIQGKPGTGKSQLAHAAAHLLQRVFLSEVIQADTEASQLLWSIDYTQRLADAQMSAFDEHARDKVGKVENYIGAGVLWWALDWESAKNQYSQHNFVPPQCYYPENSSTVRIDNGCVLLIDEIDKADISLANSLLEVLGNRRFQVPVLGKTIPEPRTTGENALPPVEPLIILTSNGNRQLPAALLRRCVVLELSLPEDLEAHFCKLGKTHYPETKEKILKQAAEQIIKDRASCKSHIATGLAEYLDLLSALHAISPEAEQQAEWLEHLSAYFYKSNAEIQ